MITKGIEESIHHLDRDNPAFFSARLPSNQCWRLFPEFRELTVYLDIETTGLERDYNEITTIALYDGATIQTGEAEPVGRIRHITDIEIAAVDPAARKVIVQMVVGERSTASAQ